MKIRLTTLCENSANIGEIVGEWGLCILVESAGLNILFDTGKSFSVVHNAEELGIDLRTVDKIVLSHAHYDHTGGLRSVLCKIKKDVEVIAHPDLWKAKYSGHHGQQYKYGGVLHRQEELEGLGAKFNLQAGPVRITDNIMTSGEIPMITSYEKIDTKLFVKESDSYTVDDVPDDLALIINTEQGLVVVLGCSHRGVINTLYHAQGVTNNKLIRIIVGGSHLFAASEEQIHQTIVALKELDVQKLGLCHCTGLQSSVLLAQEFGDKFFFNNTGTILEI